MFVVPLGVREAAGGPLNRLPVAVANEVAQALGAQVRPTIVQANVTGHTGAGTGARATRRPSFAGEVEPGRRYVIADDVATTGSTILGAINFIESRGGKVVGAVTRAAGRGGNILKARPRDVLRPAGAPRRRRGSLPARHRVRLRRAVRARSLRVRAGRARAAQGDHRGASGSAAGAGGRRRSGVGGD